MYYFAVPMYSLDCSRFSPTNNISLIANLRNLYVPSPFQLWKSDFITKQLSLTWTLHPTEIDYRYLFWWKFDFLSKNRNSVLLCPSRYYLQLNSYIPLVYTLKYCLNVDSNFIKYPFSFVILKSWNVTLQLSYN